MGEFWKNEWVLFKEDMSSLGNFLNQPVTFSSQKDDNLMLKPTYQEASEKSEATGFWKDQWSQFTKEYDSFLNYITKPIEFK